MIYRAKIIIMLYISQRWLLGADLYSMKTSTCTEMSDV